MSLYDPFFDLPTAIEEGQTSRKIGQKLISKTLDIVLLL
jgi:hypothetical protein